MIKSEKVAEEWYNKKFGILLEKNGWPDRWSKDEFNKLLAVEIKYNRDDLTDEQMFIRNLLIKEGIHYQLIRVSKDYKEVKIIFDSNKHNV